MHAVNGIHKQEIKYIFEGRNTLMTHMCARNDIWHAGSIHIVPSIKCPIILYKN